MTVRLKIKVVVGSLREAAMLRVWELVAQKHDVQILTQRLPEEGSLSTSLSIVEFPVISDMPNFFRDLDKHLRGADVVVGVEASRLYSFQALRIARKMGVPFVCLAHEYQPFVYDKYQNIRAVQHDIYTNSSEFLVTSRQAEKLLLLEGVASERIRTIPAATDSHYFSHSTVLSHKFKNYIKIPEDSLVVAIKCSLSQQDPALTVARGLRLALAKCTEAERKRVRLLICGSGGASESLKYEISDMGLGPQTLFLAQDPTAFYSDLLGSVDVLVEGRSASSEFCAGEVPWHVISALYSGANIILPVGSIADSVTADQSVVRLDDFSPIFLADALLTKVKEGRLSKEARTDRGQHAVEICSADRAAEVVFQCVENLAISGEHHTRRRGLVSFVKAHQVPVSFKEASDVLLRCEEIKEFSIDNEGQLHSEVLRIKGDALVALSKTDDALLAFEDALKQDASNHHALRGLGYLAWQGHSHEDAMRFFKRALAVDPNDYQSLVGVGLVYRRLQMFEESVFWLHKAVSVGGLESTSLSLLVQACVENAEHDGAIGVLQSIRENFGDHPNLSRAIEKLESHR